MKDSLTERWTRALLLDGETDIVHSGVRELAEYFNISESAARQACESALSDSKQEWEAVPRQSNEQIIDFYDRTRSYLFEHIWWHATDFESNTINVELLDYAIHHKAHTYLDFGSGVGSNGILAARLGFEVTLADVSRTMLDFARWRLEKRGIRAHYVYLREQQLPAEKFDAVTAMDVFEHLADPLSTLKQISAALKPGGLLLFNARPGDDPERPMHILPDMYRVWRGLRGCGLRHEIGPEADHIRDIGCQIARRTVLSNAVNFGWQMYDYFRYSNPVARIRGKL
jgi:2-polyprenyl-3-methyl-5-hydroxy-6-metoxy-1,4-benzoquinol methylase